MLPTVRIGDVDVTRLIVGGNPFSGFSHVDSALSHDMEDYYTSGRIKETLRRCEDCGINAALMRGDKHILRVLREYRLEGGGLKWIAQTTPELASFEASVRQIMAYSPSAIYHHGSGTDALFKNGETAELERRLRVLRETGRPVGLGTHLPQVVAHAEENGWDVDFYMTCVYNLNRDGIAEEIFDENDPPLMYKAIRQTQKPCLAFKILAATRRCATQKDVRAAFFDAYANIKPTDGVVVGVYPKDADHVALDCAYAAEAIAEAARGGS